MKILITGAHFTPAVAVIDELKKIDSSIKITYVGRNSTMEGDRTKSLESQILPTKDVKFIPIIAGRIQRRFSIFTLTSLLKIPIGFIQSFFIILKESPDVVLSFGGYVAVPVVFSSWIFSIPIIIHEQTLVSGLANKICSIFADRICVSFSENDFSKHDKTVLTGNPIRTEVLNPVLLNEEYKRFFYQAKKDRLPVIFVTGGNQGSHAMNLAVEEQLTDLLNIAYVIHQTGDSKYQDYERLSAVSSPRYIVRKWIGDEIGAILKNVDLITSRAGANTLTESSYWGKPMLVIPLPNIYQDEQMKNARFFDKLGLVTILNQKELSGKKLYTTLKVMFDRLPELTVRAEKSREMVVVDGAKRLALETLLLQKAEEI